jgi:choline dehydrogenase-like flavoprotein
MASTRHYDVIIIGTGAGGGTLAHALAPTGKNILVLERGGYLPRERDNWNPRAVFVDGKYKARETWINKEGQGFHPGTHYYVGGNTKVYGAVLFRMRKEDFGELRHFDGISPAWPISYEEFEPYYGRAEQLFRVHGEHGIDPTEPPASTPLPYPPLPHEPRIEQLAQDLRRLGHHPFPLPVGVRRNEQDRVDEPFMLRELFDVNGNETFDGFPDLLQYKSDSETLCIKPALAHPNVTLLTNALVTRLETDASGRQISAVICEHNGSSEAFSADIVVVACGAINSAALLLKSANDTHPDGLANRSGVVGRHYMAHNNTAFLAISREVNPTRFQKTLGVNDYYFGADDWEYPLGHMQMLGKSNADILRAEAPPLVPGMTLEMMARHALDFWLTTEDLPDPNNRVTVDQQGTIYLHYTPNNNEAHQRLSAKLKGMLRELGCHDHLFPCSLYLGKRIPLAGVAHQCGTIRFGNDPDSSALDINCKAHDLDNLYVVDGSFFVSSSAVNPALTIIANALRVGDHLAARLQ